MPRIRRRRREFWWEMRVMRLALLLAFASFIILVTVLVFSLLRYTVILRVFVFFEFCIIVLDFVEEYVAICMVMI